MNSTVKLDIKIPHLHKNLQSLEFLHGTTFCRFTQTVKNPHEAVEWFYAIISKTVKFLMKIIVFAV